MIANLLSRIVGPAWNWLPPLFKRSHVSSEDREMPISQVPRLPLELLVAIADQLPSHQDIVAFGLTCKDLYSLLVNKHRRSLEIRFEGRKLPYVKEEAPVYRLLNQQAAILAFSGHEGRGSPDNSDPREGLAPCNRWGLANSLTKAIQLFNQDDYKFAKSIKELTLTGYFPVSEWHTTLNSHAFIRSSGFKAIQPETFIVRLGLIEWDFSVLEGMSVHKLKRLRLPISLPSDCVRLGQALTNMPKLVSLAITDIPDRAEFTTGLKDIGKGIMSCASTLRQLEIEMSNFNHPEAWSRDERFVEPEEVGFFFRKLFPCLPKKESSAISQRHRGVGQSPLVEGRVDLTKLRLKHMSLPRYTFGMIFNAMTIKDINLPYSNVDGEVWRTLQTYAELDSLTEISYAMLSAEFLHFLSRQKSLKSLTFMRPQDQYVVKSVIYYGDSPDMTYRVSKPAPRMGPDSGAGYPSLDDFSSSFKDLTSLKHLALPLDMYTITSSSLISLAASLTSLERVELGFDLKDNRLREAFASTFLCGMPTLKKITLLPVSLLFDSEGLLFQKYVQSLGSKVSTNLRFLRYRPLVGRFIDPRRKAQTFYHRETKPRHGGWWVPISEDSNKDYEQIFAEGRTPRIFPSRISRTEG